MGGFVCHHGWQIYGKPGFKHRGDRTANNFKEFARQYRSRNMDYYRLFSDDDILAVFLGRLADLYGRVRLYNLGFAVFTLGSLLCALSRNGEQLVIFRFLQGIGAALLTINSVAIITDAFPEGELGMGIGTSIMAMNLGAIAGYTISGMLITSLGWRSNSRLMCLSEFSGPFGGICDLKKSL